MQILLNYNKADFTSIGQELKNTDWDSMLQGNTHECWTKFRERFKILEEMFVPTKSKVVGTRRLPGSHRRQ